MTQIHQIRHLPFGAVNTYLIQGERTIIVDTGVPGSSRRILHHLDLLQIPMKKVALILLTHRHVDHAGSALELRNHLQVPIALHPLDHEPLRTGQIIRPTATGLYGQIFMQTSVWNQPIPPFAADVLLKDHFDLQEYGVNAEVFHTPGHTPGHISIQVAKRDIIAGDALAGYWIHPSKPGYPPFHDHLHDALRSARALLDRKPEHIHVGHGGPLHHPRADRWLRLQERKHL